MTESVTPPLTNTTNPVVPADMRARGDAFLSDWQGAPFLWDGRSPAGVDCWGVVVRFHADVKGQALPDWARGDHGRAWIARTIAGEAKTHWRPLDTPQDGAIVKALAHVGIYWRGGVLHASDHAGVIWERWADFALQYPGAEFGVYVP